MCEKSEFSEKLAGPGDAPEPEPEPEPDNDGEPDTDQDANPGTVNKTTSSAGGSGGCSLSTKRSASSLPFAAVCFSLLLIAGLRKKRKVQ